MLTNLRRRISILPSFNINASHSIPFFRFSSASLPSPLLDEDPQIPSLNSVNSLSKSQLQSLVLARYANGTFTDLVSNVVVFPPVLVAACRNLAAISCNGSDPGQLSSLLRSVSKRFSLQELGREIRENRFDIEAACVKMASPMNRGEYLVLPNLKLKVLVEAIRMVLEIVYDERFVTFSYGGRIGMGRHTAIRYLKNSVENPSWWFSVSFNHEKFDNRHVDKLCMFIQEKINDKILIDIIKRLFECKVVGVELGSCYFGRGFPQESGLSSILVNVYFNGFDKELHEMRLQKNQESSKFVSNELVSKDDDDVFYKPVKIYAVRYLDEILVITSGSKMLTLDFKNWVLKYLEGRLELKVDTVKTAIHSAVSEKIDFIGMELQAVQPSVLHPPVLEKAMRARKKYLRQKEVRALELKNARERNRKKLRMKILSHLKVNPIDNDKWVKGMGAIHGSFNRKCLPLCPDHIHDFYMGRITFQDIDCASFVDVD